MNHPVPPDIQISLIQSWMCSKINRCICEPLLNENPEQGSFRQGQTQHKQPLIVCDKSAELVDVRAPSFGKRERRAKPGYLYHRLALMQFPRAYCVPRCLANATAGSITVVKAPQLALLSSLRLLFECASPANANIKAYGLTFTLTKQFAPPIKSLVACSNSDRGFSRTNSRLREELNETYR